MSDSAPWHLTFEDAVRATRLTEEQYRPRPLAEIVDTLGPALSAAGRGFRSVAQQEKAQRNMRRAVDFSLRFGSGPMAKAYQEAEAEQHREYVRKKIAIDIHRAFWNGHPNPFARYAGYFYSLSEETEETLRAGLLFVERYGLPLSAQDLTILT